jgi:hypothetical protein
MARIMAEVVSGSNLTTIVLDESEVEALKEALTLVDMDAKMSRGEYSQEICDKLISLFDALEV